MLDQWIILIGMILGPKYYHPNIYEISIIVKTDNKVSACIQT